VAAWAGPGAPPPAAALGTPPQGPTARATPVRCDIRYQVEKDWRTGFAAIVTVTNAGAADLSDATLWFRFPGGQTIVSGERWRQDGRDVSADLVLPRGGSQRLRFTANYQRENPLPLAFLVDGTTCRAVVTGAAYAAEKREPSNSGPGSPDRDSSGPGPGPGPGHGKDDKKKEGERARAT
jgi:hypothetical protein